MPKIITTEQFIEKAKFVHKDTFDYSKCNYIRYHVKVEIICKIHGSFFTFPATHTNGTKWGGCALCAKNCKYTNEDFIIKSKSIHGEKYDYSLVEYTSNIKYVKIICPIHGIFEQTPSNHYNYGCLACGGCKQKTVEQFIIDANIIHQGKYDYTQSEYLTSHTKIKIICKDHGEFWQTPSNHIHFGGRGCPKCSKRISKNEVLWLDSLNLPNDKSHRNVYIKTTDNKYWVDGFDPITKTVYEFDGDYWHGNLLIYNENDIHPETKLTFKDLWIRTVKKKEDLISDGYEVVSIWETDFLKSNCKKNKIIIDNKYCQIITEDEKIFSEIKNLLSYKLDGVEYTPAYKNGWDGTIYLLDREGYFYSGLLSVVKNYIRENNYSFEEIDHSIKLENNKEIDLTEKLKQYNLIPRKHQLDILNAVISNQKGIVRACTGSGKTLAIAMATAKFNSPTMIYVIGLDLLDQFYKLFSKLFDEPIGYIGNGVCNVHRINIASIWTVGNVIKLPAEDIIIDDEEKLSENELDESQKTKLLEALANTKVHFFDEGHIISTKTATQIYKIINPIRIYGFSGTPFRDDNSDLLINGILGEQIINISASELINLDLLAAPLIKFYTVPKMTVGNIYSSVYKQYIVENEIRNNLIIKISQELVGKNYTPLVLFKQIKHGNILLEKMQITGIRCQMLYGNDTLEKRNEVKKLLIEKKIDIILASTIFDIGLDLPQLNALILCGGGKSSIRALQRIGRVIRPMPGKKIAAIVDFYDQVKFLKKHSLARYRIYSSEKGFKIIKSKEMK